MARLKFFRNLAMVACCWFLFHFPNQLREKTKFLQLANNCLLYLCGFFTMSDEIKHECGLAFIRLRKPFSYYQQKYGSVLWGLISCTC